jgi:hypothetical protein
LSGFHILERVIDQGHIAAVAHDAAADADGVVHAAVASVPLAPGLAILG